MTESKGHVKKYDVDGVDTLFEELSDGILKNENVSKIICEYVWTDLFTLVAAQHHINSEWTIELIRNIYRFYAKASSTNYVIISPMDAIGYVECRICRSFCASVAGRNICNTCERKKCTNCKVKSNTNNVHRVCEKCLSIICESLEEHEQSIIELPLCIQCHLATKSQIAKGGTNN